MVCLPISPRRLNPEVRILARNLIFVQEIRYFFSTGALIGSGAGAVVSEIVPRTPPETGARLCFAPTVKSQRWSRRKSLLQPQWNEIKSLQNRKHRKSEPEAPPPKAAPRSAPLPCCKEPKQ